MSEAKPKRDFYLSRLSDLRNHREIRAAKVPEGARRVSKGEERGKI